MSPSGGCNTAAPHILLHPAIPAAGCHPDCSAKMSMLLACLASFMLPSLLLLVKGNGGDPLMLLFGIQLQQGTATVAGWLILAITIGRTYHRH